MQTNYLQLQKTLCVLATLVEKTKMAAHNRANVARVAGMGRCDERGAFRLSERVTRRADAARGADGSGAGRERRTSLCLLQVRWDFLRKQSLHCKYAISQCLR